MIKIFADAAQLNHFAAKKFVEIANASINAENKCFTVALAGGSTPKSLYQLLSSDEYKNQVDWSKVFFFFGDERNVESDNAESNFQMVNKTLFVPLQIADENIFRWKTERRDAELTAVNYELNIWNFFESKNILIDNFKGSEYPPFDLILLGMGADGHTASLFPFTKVLKERKLIAAANPVEKLDTTRLTVTFPLINNARNVIFLVKGTDKAETLRAVLKGEFQPEKYPAQAVKPVSGELLWLIDSNAARFLT